MHAFILPSFQRRLESIPPVNPRPRPPHRRMDSSLRWNDETQGFSLVELSIVLVILGLLVGGILAGRSLVQAAALRNVVTEVTRYTTAVHGFRDKYFALPGDITNASVIWGALDNDDGLDADCGMVESADARTCNGDGDGFIDGLKKGGYEKLRAWQHLANAGLIEGRYTGSVNADGAAKAGVAHAASKLAPMGYEMHKQERMFRTYGRNMLKLGEWNGGSGLNNAALSPEQAWNLDRKLDDGRPDSGKFLAIDSENVAGCVSSGVAYTLSTYGDYTLTNRFKACRAYYFAGF